MYLASRRKRIFDITGCFVSLFIFGPPAALIAFLIFADERKKILFRQERIGLNEKTFLIYKFRTMTDGKVTRVGRWLRKTGLDELPQYWNVIKGDLSIVGPRPLTNYDIERLKWRNHKFRWEMKPGLTGLAQIRAGTSAMHSLSADQEYFQTASLRRDCMIIGVSFLMNVFGKQRVRSAGRWLGI